MRAAAAVTGRELVHSAAHVLCVGRDDAEVRRRADAIGASRVYLQTLDLNDLDHLELVAAEVARQV